MSVLHDHETSAGAGLQPGPDVYGKDLLDSDIFDDRQQVGFNGFVISERLNYKIEPAKRQAVTRETVRN